MKIQLVAMFIGVALALGGCYGLYGHDEFDRYAQRTDVITMSAGDAKQVNAATHTDNPWPVYVGDRRIPVHGERMQRAADKYLRPKAGGGQTTATSTVTSEGAGAAATAGGGR